MRTVHWLPTFAVIASTLFNAGALTWSIELCNEWPTGAVTHQLGVELEAGEIATRIERIRLACMAHQDFTCSVVGNAIKTAAVPNPAKAALTLRLSPAGIGPMSDIASSEGRITAQIMRNVGPYETAGLPDWIAVKSAHRARIKALLARTDLTESHEARLASELQWVDGRMGELAAANNELRPRADTHTLYVEFTAVPSVTTRLIAAYRAALCRWTSVCRDPHAYY